MSIKELFVQCVFFCWKVELQPTVFFVWIAKDECITHAHTPFFLGPYSAQEIPLFFFSYQTHTHTHTNTYLIFQKKNFVVLTK